ncbi:MAG: hypothetical protein FWE22_08410 [Firmicutes bacterium]|nr:hypothetical protein [Bacillota bacterium]
MSRSNDDFLDSFNALEKLIFPERFEGEKRKELEEKKQEDLSPIEFEIKEKIEKLVDEKIKESPNILSLKTSEREKIEKVLKDSIRFSTCYGELEKKIKNGKLKETIEKLNSFSFGEFSYNRIAENTLATEIKLIDIEIEKIRKEFENELPKNKTLRELALEDEREEVKIALERYQRAVDENTRKINEAKEKRKKEGVEEEINTRELSPDEKKALLLEKVEYAKFLMRVNEVCLTDEKGNIVTVDKTKQEEIKHTVVKGKVEKGRAKISVLKGFRAADFSVQIFGRRDETYSGGSVHIEVRDIKQGEKNALTATKGDFVTLYFDYEYSKGVQIGNLITGRHEEYEKNYRYGGWFNQEFFSNNEIKTLTKKDIDKQLENLRNTKLKDGSYYLTAPTPSAMCYMMATPKYFITKRKCSECGETMKILTSEFRRDEIPELEDLAKQFKDAGLDAELKEFCFKCTKENNSKSIEIHLKAKDEKEFNKTYPNLSYKIYKPSNFYNSYKNLSQEDLKNSYEVERSYGTNTSSNDDYQLGILFLDFAKYANAFNEKWLLKKNIDEIKDDFFKNLGVVEFCDETVSYRGMQQIHGYFPVGLSKTQIDKSLNKVFNFNINYGKEEVKKKIEMIFTLYGRFPRLKNCIDLAHDFLDSRKKDNFSIFEYMRFMKELYFEMPFLSEKSAEKVLCDIVRDLGYEELYDFDQRLMVGAAKDFLTKEEGKSFSRNEIESYVKKELIPSVSHPISRFARFLTKELGNSYQIKNIEEHAKKLVYDKKDIEKKTKHIIELIEEESEKVKKYMTDYSKKKLNEAIEKLPSIIAFGLLDPVLKYEKDAHLKFKEIKQLQIDTNKKIKELPEELKISTTVQLLKGKRRYSWEGADSEENGEKITFDFGGGVDILV